MPTPSPVQYNHRDVMVAARRRRKLILRLARHGHTHQQIAQLFQITKQRVGQIVEKAKREA